ncbi:MAG: hypothetical protein KDC92_10220 [Bacteroidetes bacterium]|nr:hypothetical protein [Bacteroidota bacterium]
MKSYVLNLFAVLTIIAITAFGIAEITHAKSPNNAETDNLTCKAESTAMLGPFRSTDHEFVFEIGPRFQTTIKQSKVLKAKGAQDVLPEDHLKFLSDFRNIKLDTLPNNNDARVSTLSTIFDSVQLAKLTAVGHNSHFYIEANCLEYNPKIEVNNPYDLVYYISVVPEVEAQHSWGVDSLQNYLKIETAGLMHLVDWDKLTSGNMSFTVNAKGELEQVILKMSCGIFQLDEHLLAVFRKLPGNWTPAKDANGKAVSQQLYFFFGRKGC